MRPVNLRKMDATQFNWSTWRAGTITDLLNVPQRTHNLIKNKVILNKYAIGWCPAEELICRPKENCVAIMFHFHGTDFWTHLTNKEFEIIFCKE